MTYTNDQAGLLSQIMLVMFIATALNARFEGRTKDRKDRQLLVGIYLLTVTALLANVIALLVGYDVPSSNLAFWILIVLNGVAIAYNALILFGHALVLLRGLRDPVIEPDVKHAAQHSEQGTQHDPPRWSFHIEYRDHKKPRKSRGYQHSKDREH